MSKTTARMPFLKLYIDDWIAGTTGLTVEQEGFYIRVVLRMAARKAGLPDDDKWLSAHLNMDPRSVRRLKTFFVEQGKLKIRDGLLVNERVLSVIGAYKKQQSTGEDRAKIGRRSLGDRAKIAGRSGEDRAKIEAKNSETPTKSTERTAIDAQSPSRALEDHPEARVQKPDSKQEGLQGGDRSVGGGLGHGNVADATERSWDPVGIADDPPRVVPVPNGRAAA